ncbi:glycosyltransferase [Streptomyces sp. H27-D2]|uniref:glycosyltransferase n=1 Tax=Streptomyces sp. H27-D2 TaxID=3046304 RepID=UPI002DBAACF3|nr:glycosyltransferase [Streptomyces sp. H27-D2]MEC4017831.1 glycosyltransferase [Streptomyces sp. H27-D2]
MKVLHVVTLHTPDHAFGGPTRVALNLSRGLRARGVEAALVTLGDGFEGPLPTTVEGVPARLFQARHVLARFEVSGITSGAMLARARKLVMSADVVHVHLMRDLITLPMALIALSCGRPLVIQTHGMVDPTEKKVAKIVDALGIRRVLRKADAVLCLTDKERADVEAVVAPGRLRRSVRLVNGVAPQERGPSTRESRAERPATVLYLARVQAGKRPEDFVAAIPGVLAQRPDTRFLLAGPDTGGLAATLELARELGVSDSLEYLGALDRDEVYEQLRRADVYVLPSIQEALGVSALEAMSVGTPVVVTRTCGLAPDVAGAGAGRVVDSRPDSENDNGPRIARAVLELLDPAEHEKASDAAWQLIRDSFTIDAVVEKLAGVYEEVAGRVTTTAVRGS